MTAPISPTAVLASHRELTPRQAGACESLLPAVSRWKDDRLVEQVQAARADKLPIVMAHGSAHAALIRPNPARQCWRGPSLLPVLALPHTARINDSKGSP